jgi:hypothetical protein
MSKRSRDEFLDEITKDFIKRVRDAQLETIVDTTPEPTVFNTTMTPKDDEKIRCLVFKTVGDIVQDGLLSQLDTKSGVREYFFTVEFPNEITDIQLSTLMQLGEFALITIKEGTREREFIVTMFYTLNAKTKNMIVKQHMFTNTAPITSSGDTTVDCILQRIDGCVSRDKENQQETSLCMKEELAGIKITTLSAKLKSAVTYDAVLGIKALGVIHQICFAASAETCSPIIKIDFKVTKED